MEYGFLLAVGLGTRQRLSGWKSLPPGGEERMTGINQKQFQHYASGLKKPRQAQVKKIEAAMHELGRELMAVEL